MGFFDDVGGFFNNVGNKIGGFFGDVKKVAVDAFNGAKGVVSEVFGTVKDLAKSVVSAPVQLVDKVLDKGGAVVKDVVGATSSTIIGAAREAGGAIQGVGASFAWPLALAAGVVGLAFVMNKK